MEVGLVFAVVGLGIIHGVLPDHGWPIAATYALAFDAKWFRGTIAALILGIGHLISSIALVLAYFWVSTFADFAEGPYMKPLAGGLLILLGIYEYVSGGHAHGHADGDDEHAHHGDHQHNHEHSGHQHNHVHSDHQHNHEHSEHQHNHHDHSHNQGHQHGHNQPGHGELTEGHSHAHSEGWLGRFRELLPGGSHTHLTEEHAEQGLVTLGVTALLLGFAHEEPVQILAICAGTEFCLELMLVYSIAVIGAILAPTLLLIAGYEHYRERIERYTPYLPTLTAVVLVLVGSWFVLSGVL